MLDRSGERATRAERAVLTERIAIVRNPRSGSAPDATALESALKNCAVTAEILDAPERGIASWIDGLSGKYDVLVAAGGDGTVSTVATVAARSQKTLGIIPTGTLNHFARDLGIPADIEESVALIQTGRQRAVDIGVVNDHFFLNNVSLGNYPRMVQVRERLEAAGRSHAVATAMAIARTWWHLGKQTAYLNIDGRELVRSSPFFLVGNGSYTLSGLALGTRDKINDGCLSLYVAPSTGRIGVLSLPLRAIAGTLERHEQFETFSAQRMSAVFSKRRIEAGIDGEIQLLDTPLEFSVRQAALRVLLPRDSRLPAPGSRT